MFRVDGAVGRSAAPLPGQKIELMKDVLKSLIALAIYAVINTSATVNDARDNTSADRYFGPTRQRDFGPVRDPFDPSNGAQKPPPIEAIVGSERWFLD